MRRFLCGVTIVGALSGCTSFAPRADAPTAVAPREFPRTVRLVRADSSRITLFQARLEADTIRGEAANGLAMKVAAKDVVRWEARRFDGENTAGMAIVAAAAAKLLWEVFKPEVVTWAPGGAVVRTP